MKTLAEVRVLLQKDLLLEWRARDLFAFLCIFALSVVLLFSFAWDVSSEAWVNLAPGVLWTALLFAGVLSFSRSFAVEKESECLEPLLIAPVSRSSLFLAKALASLLWLMLLALIIYPAFFILHDLAWWDRLGKILLVHAIANTGFIALGVLLAGIALHARAREVLLPILLFPLVIPLFICAIETTGSVLREGVFGGWFATMSCVSVVLAMGSWLLCEWVWDER